jgi:3-isopropylmalate dehydrogenase
MSTPTTFEIAVLPGDGIGREVTPAAVAVMQAAVARVGRFELRFSNYAAGAQHYAETGTALSDEVMKAIGTADAILFGAMGMPHIRYPDGTEIAPQLDIRVAYELYAGVRPIRSIPGLPSPLANPRAAEIDFVLIREQTEGLFYSRGRGEVFDDREARDTMLLTRKGTARVSDFAFRLAERRKAQGKAGRVTWIDKANVFASMAFARKVFLERAALFPQLLADCAYVDAMALNLIRHPWAFDVMVTENMFGDILSDLAAGLVGGMGMAPSGDIGDRHALFQPAHGSAPDIAGQGKANPTATFLSAAMLLEWLGDRHGQAGCIDAADLLVRAVERSFLARRVLPYEYGGQSGTAAITAAVLEALTASSQP